MLLKKYTDLDDFYSDTYDILMRHEAQNIVPLGNLLIGMAGTDKTGWRDPKNWLMIGVSDSDGIILTAIMTPPMYLTLYATDNKLDKVAIDCLIEGLQGDSISGVMSEKELALCFAEAWAKVRGVSYEIEMDQKIYELREVNPDIPKIGTLRRLDERDMPFFPYWLEGFSGSVKYANTTMSIPSNDKERYHYRISQGSIYILEDDDIPVSMAGLPRRTKTVCALNYVYTPPYFRGCGYASSIVSSLSQIALDEGFESVALYTDLANPTSNSIYQKIGYREICDSLMIKFLQ